jgi:hypothetical protein
MSDVSVPDSVEAVDSPDSPSTTSTQSFLKSTHGLPNWLTFAALALALVAVAFSVFGWFLPTSNSDKFSAEQAADAKKQICQVSTSVRRAVVVTTNGAGPAHRDPSGAVAVEVNSRLALLGGGTYLQTQLAKQPATPADLAKAVDSLANTLQELGIGYLAQAPNTANKQLRGELNNGLERVNKLCH